jgi:hypothetical protein
MLEKRRHFGNEYTKRGRRVGKPRMIRGQNKDD